MPAFTKSAKKLVKRGQRDISRVESIAIDTATRAMQRLRASVIKSFVDHKEFEASTVVNQLLPILQRASAIMYASGQRRSVLMLNQQLPKAKRDAKLEEARWPWSGDTLELDLYSTVAKLVKKTLNVNISVIEQQYGPEVGDILSEFSDKVESKVRKRVGELITSGINTRDAVKDLQGLLGDLGADGVSGTQLETVFRTQLQTAFNAGRWDQDQDPDIQEILWGYKYVTAGDDRVRESHEVWDGVTLPKDHEFWQTHWPPNGWNCRCQVIPIFDKREEVEPDEIVEPDEGFSGNPGKLFGGGLSFDPNQPRNPDGTWGTGGSAPDKGGGSGGGSKERALKKITERQRKERAARAKAAYNPSTKEKQDESEAYEHEVTKQIDGVKSDDNKPMDIVVDEKHGVELKVMHDAKEGRVNMRPDSRKRKEEWAKEKKGRTLHTVLIDNRDKFDGGAHKEKYSGHKIYYKQGVGAFKLNTMTKVKDFSELKKIIRTK